ncbi:ABC transporter ATP-binding protein [Sediminicola luteus]|uniref:ABC transporter domain-containing protein n=1 Tax=Sediminicola luteus TaxID=319238 RepID=A0A2A4G3U4_9FLAO|nr:ABC transporter ATP-binding protein [Sediminicola luteus]PCE63347.1 hypothetical protein B7P33_14100 [Sediminicola luteus]
MIKTNNLHFHYKKNQDVFTGLSFEIEHKGIIGLLGKNGIGKTTLLHLLAGLIFPKAGELKVGDQFPMQRRPEYLSKLFFLPDVPFVPQLSIAAYTKAYAPLYPDFDAEKMQGILKDFELEPKLRLDKLSLGQQKKAMMAFALATGCSLLLLDEPTNGLDIPSKSIFRKILVESITDAQTVILSTHLVKDVENILDGILILERGEIVLNQSVDQISQRLQFVKTPVLPEDGSVLYYEKCLEGYHILQYAETDDYTEMDIELLFNALCHQPTLTI